jgi:hypothetical protein
MRSWWLIVMVVGFFAAAVTPTMAQSVSSLSASGGTAGLARAVMIQFDQPATANGSITVRSGNGDRALVTVWSSIFGSPPAVTSTGRISRGQVASGFSMYCLQNPGPVSLFVSVNGGPETEFAFDVAPTALRWDDFGWNNLQEWQTGTQRVAVCTEAVEQSVWIAGGLTVRFWAEPPGIVGIGAARAESFEARTGPNAWPCTFYPGEPNGYLELHPIKAGTATVHAQVLDAPGAPVLSRQITVSPARVSLTLAGFYPGLATTGAFSLTGHLHGGGVATVRSLNPSRVLVAPSREATPVESFEVAIPDGVAVRPVTVHTLDSAAGTADIEVEFRNLRATESRNIQPHPSLNVTIPSYLRESEGSASLKVGVLQYTGFDAPYTVSSLSQASVTLTSSDPSVAAFVGDDGVLRQSVTEVLSQGGVGPLAFPATLRHRLVALSTGNVRVDWSTPWSEPASGSQNVRVLSTDAVVLSRASYVIGAGLMIPYQELELGRSRALTTPVTMRSTDPDSLRFGAWNAAVSEEIFLGSAKTFSLVAMPGAVNDNAGIEISGEGIPTTIVPVRVVPPSVEISVPSAYRSFGSSPGVSAEVAAGVADEAGVGLAERQVAPRWAPFLITVSVDKPEVVWFCDGQTGCIRVAQRTVPIPSDEVWHLGVRSSSVSLRGCPGEGVVLTATVPGGLPIATSSAQTRIVWEGDPQEDGVVNFTDITAVLASFGNVYPPSGEAYPGDANFDFKVNMNDMSIVLSRFGMRCPWFVAP